MTSPIVIVGAGGHARVVIATLRACNAKIAFAVDSDPKLHGKDVSGIEIRGSDELLLKHSPKEFELANGLGSTGSTDRRRDVFDRFRERGFRFRSVVHPTAWVAEDVKMGAGVQLMAGSIVQPGTVLQDNSLLNTGAQVDHDCQVGAHSHIAPGAVLSGGVRVGVGAHVGAGAVIIQGLSVGDGSIIGAGAVVLGDVPAGSLAIGNPAQSRPL